MVVYEVDWNTIQKVVRGVIAATVHERDHAANGPIFAILQSAHPDATDAALRAAIQTAADFEATCIRHFKYTGASLLEDADRAIGIAAL